MKRVYLHLGDDQDLVNGRRRTAMALIAAYLAGGSEGRVERIASSVPQDPVFEWVTEGRQRENTQRRAAQKAAGLEKIEVPYSACGDGCHATAWCAGVRNESIINRSTDGGQLKWAVGMNLARFSQSPIFRRTSCEIVRRGDIVYVQSPDHVFVALDDGELGKPIRTAEYGAFRIITEGEQKNDIVRARCGSRIISSTAGGKVYLYGPTTHLYGYFPATEMPFSESAWIPTEEEASFDPIVKELYDALMALGPTDDDSPYAETDAGGRSAVVGITGLPAWSAAA